MKREAALLHGLKDMAAGTEEFLKIFAALAVGIYLQTLAFHHGICYAKAVTLMAQ